MKYDIGTIRRCFGMELMANIYRAVSECQHLREPYYIYFWNQADMTDGNLHRTHIRVARKDQLKKIIPTVNGKIVPMLGTGLIRVDNEKGEMRWVWCLPRDIPHTQAIEGDVVVEDVAQGALNIKAPILLS